jgi:hypothetical protein
MTPLSRFLTAVLALSFFAAPATAARAAKPYEINASFPNQRVGSGVVVSKFAGQPLPLRSETHP